MMCCCMIICGIFIFEGKSRVLLVIVMWCFWNIFWCWSVCYWCGSVVMFNGDFRFDCSYCFNFCCDFSDYWCGRLSNNFRFSNYNFSSFDNFFNICCFFLWFNYWFCLFCNFLGYGNIRFGNYLWLFSYCGSNYFRMCCFNYFWLRFGNLNGGFYDIGYFFNNWCVNNWFDSGGDRDFSYYWLYMYFFLFVLFFNLYILWMYNWIVDLDFVRGQFWRCVCYG